MQIPAIQGLIDRRILVNYRVDPAVMQRVLPAPFRPKLIGGSAMAGICLIRLKQIRPKFLRVPLGIGSENAAHRVAVEWDEDGSGRQGVFIFRRDTDSRFNSLAGGRFFPGEHRHASFVVEENAEQLSITVRSDDGATSINVRGSIGSKLPQTSVFQSLEEASEFFRASSLGYSVTSDPTRFDGLELRCTNWSASVVEIEHVDSSYFDNPDIFPAGSIQFDCALLMQGIKHEWHGRQDLCCTVSA